MRDEIDEWLSPLHLRDTDVSTIWYDIFMCTQKLV